jgi:hypothetical protein
VPPTDLDSRLAPAVAVLGDLELNIAGLGQGWRRWPAEKISVVGDLDVVSDGAGLRRLGLASPFVAIAAVLGRGRLRVAVWAVRGADRRRHQRAVGPLGRV